MVPTRSGPERPKGQAVSSFEAQWAGQPTWLDQHLFTVSEDQSGVVGRIWP